MLSLIHYCISIIIIIGIKETDAFLFTVYFHYHNQKHKYIQGAHGGLSFYTLYKLVLAGNVNFPVLKESASDAESGPNQPRLR